MVFEKMTEFRAGFLSFQTKILKVKSTDFPLKNCPEYDYSKRLKIRYEKAYFIIYFFTFAENYKTLNKICTGH